MGGVEALVSFPARFWISESLDEWRLWGDSCAGQAPEHPEALGDPAIGTSQVHDNPGARSCDFDRVNVNQTGLAKGHAENVPVARLLRGPSTSHRFRGCQLSLAPASSPRAGGRYFRGGPGGSCRADGSCVMSPEVRPTDATPSASPSPRAAQASPSDWSSI